MLGCICSHSSTVKNGPQNVLFSEGDTEDHDQATRNNQMRWLFFNINHFLMKKIFINTEFVTREFNENEGNEFTIHINYYQLAYLSFYVLVRQLHKTIFLIKLETFWDVRPEHSKLALFSLYFWYINIADKMEVIRGLKKIEVINHFSYLIRIVLFKVQTSWPSSCKACPGTF